MKREEFMQLLKEAEDNRNPRVECPCCGKSAQIYKRKFGIEMAIFLVKLVAAARKNEKWFTITEVLGSTQVGKQKVATDGTYLVHWGLVKKPDAETARVLGGSKGLYYPTEAGKKFVLEPEKGAATSYAPLYIRLYNNELYEVCPERVTILDLLPGGKEQWKELLYGE